MSQELTVALRIKAFLSEARAAVRDFNKDLKDVGTAADQAGAKLGAVKPGGATSAQGLKETAQAAAVAAAGTKEVVQATNEAVQATMTWRQFLKQQMGPAMKEFTAQGMQHAEAHTAAIRKIAEEWKVYKASAAAAAPALRQVATEGSKAAETATAAASAQAKHNTTLQQGAMSAKQTAMAMRMLPMQITDIVTSLASGMPAHMVLIQQGGQIRDSFGGVTASLKAMLSMLTPARLVIGAVAGAVAALVLAYKQGSAEQDTFNRGIAMSGNAAGVSAGELADMARNVDRVVGTQAAAADTLAQLVATGRVGRQDLEEYAIAAVQMERTTGQAVSETVKNFAELGKAPLEATLKLNESLRYMTATLYDQLQALMRNGQEARAAALAQSAYANALAQASTTVEANLGTLERAWRGVAGAAKDAWDWMLGVGRKDTLQQQLDAVTKEIEKARGPFDPSAFGGNAEARARLKDNLLLQASLQEQIRLLQRGGEARADAAKTTDEYVKARQANQRYADAALNNEQRLQKKIEEYRRNNAKIRAGGGIISPEQERREEQAIREEVYGKGSALETAKARAALQRATLEANLRLLQAAIKDGDAIIVQAVADGNLSIAAAYAARLSQLTTESEAQRRVYEAEAAEIDKALRSAKTDAERAPLQQQRVEVLAKLKLLDSSLAEGARQLATWKTEQERQLATISARIRVDVSGLTGAFDREAVRAQIAEGMRGDRQAVGRMADPAEAAAATQRLDMIAAAGLAQAEFNARLAEAQRLQAQLSVTEGALQVQQQQGAISQVELEGRMRAARAAQLPLLQDILVKLQAIRAAMPPEAAAAIDAMTKNIGDLQNQAAAAAPVVTDLGTRLRNTAIDGLADAAAQAVTNFKNLRSSVAGMLKQIAGDIVRSGIKKALADQFSGAGAGGGGGGGGFLSAAVSIGRAIFGFAQGGLIRGPGTGTSDSIPALVGGQRPIAVSNNEFIQPQKAVQHYGLGFMEAVRTLKMPKPGFAFGGLVRAQQRARFATGGQVAGGGQAASVTVQMINNGTPQRVVDQRQQFDGRQMVVSVVLEDLNRGGPIAQAMRRS